MRESNNFPGCQQWNLFFLLFSSLALYPFKMLVSYTIKLFSKRQTLQFMLATAILTSPTLISTLLTLILSSLTHTSSLLTSLLLLPTSFLIRGDYFFHWR